ncbi:MAG: response regulator [Candidatus Eremiobacteraeota bacterium]|nr:response regulator [Candidatus Eremiobacteraeota bacterium]MBC5801475.1 response regulator [Candidatus Eremiobacteraeota bacterium]MBC5820925.1 response regulator [Candidatus Eremiobacteraeota bacterium]
MNTEPGAGGPAKRVLIADDDAAVCALLRVALGPLAEVTTVADAEAALALLANDSGYDAIISDFMLPGISGLEFVQRLRAECRRVPILMISGHGALGIGERARAAGVDAFLDKPFSLAQLRGTVVAMLRQNDARVA